MWIHRHVRRPDRSQCGAAAPGRNQRGIAANQLTTDVDTRPKAMPGCHFGARCSASRQHDAGCRGMPDGGMPTRWDGVSQAALVDRDADV